MTDGGSMKQKSSRIPLALQAVFLASNRGNEVHQPPPDKSASKVFFGNWLFQRRDDAKGKKKNASSPTKQCPVSTATNSTGAMHFAVPLKMYRQASRVDILSASDHTVRLTNRSSDLSISTRSMDSSLSASSHEKQTSRLSPQGYLDVLIRSRGFLNERFKALQTGYSNAPTPLQVSSYDPMLVELVKRATDSGESLIHIIARRGDSKILKLFLDYGASIQVSDSHGRTPLHEACWAKPCFDTIDLILKADVHLLNMADERCAVPLSYVRKDYWKQWIQFLKTKQDVYWPHAVDTRQDPPPLSLLEPDSRPLADPLNALSPKQAAMVVSGRLAPEAATSAPLVHFEFGEEEGDDGAYDDDSDSFASDYNNNDDTCFTTDTFDMNEMENLLRQLSQPAAPYRIEI